MKKPASLLLCALMALLALSGCVRTDAQLPTDAEALVLMEVYSVETGYRATVAAAEFSGDGTSYTYSADQSYAIDLAEKGFAADLYVQEEMRLPLRAGAVRGMGARGKGSGVQFRL